MVQKKLFALASVSALGGLVAAAAASGCSSTEVINTPADAAPKTDGPTSDRRVPPPDPEEPAEVDCKDTTATFTETKFNAAFPQSGTACTPAQITAFADACQIGTKDPNTEAACVAARDLPANKTCAACIFGAKADTVDHVITLLPNEKPSARINQTACIDHATGIPGCGGDFINVSDCFDTYCKTVADGGKCSEDGSDLDACTKGVAAKECQEFLISTECLDGIKANQDKCLLSEQSAKGFRTLFINFSTVACATAGANPQDG